MRCETIDIVWIGPFAWPGLKGQSVPDPELRGVYLWTVEYRDGYLIYAAGITRRPMQKRFRDHTCAYVSGIYTLFDMDAMQRGLRKELWHGF